MGHRHDAKAMAKLDKQLEAKKPRLHRPVGEEECKRLEAGSKTCLPQSDDLPHLCVGLAGAPSLCA